jgi:hypothetical protein
MEVWYPSSLPAPQTSTLQPAERRVIETLNGPFETRPFSLDRLAAQPVTFVLLNGDQVNNWLTFGRTTLHDWAGWFAARWPQPFGGAGVRRFVGVPSYPEYLPGVGWRVSAQVQLRGRGTIPDDGLGDGSVLKDTFTAADDTDPTTRDMDAHPGITGLSRWRSDGTNPAGVIETNILRPIVLTDIAYRVLLFAYGDGSEIFVDAFPYFLFLEANRGDGASADEQIRLNVASDSATYAEVGLDATGVYGDAISETNTWTTTSSSPLSAGTHKVGLHVAQNGVTLIADGSIVDSSGSIDMGSGVPINFARLQITGDVNVGPYTDEGIASVGVYVGVSLDAAIAMTIPT